MATDTALTATGDHERADGTEDHHPADSYYVRIAIILAVLTGIEVALSYLGAPTLVEVGGLLFVMAIKFVMVALHFMHLKFDSKVLTRVFYSGLLLAVSVYVAALFTFRIF